MNYVQSTCDPVATWFFTSNPLTKDCWPYALHFALIVDNLQMLFKVDLCSDQSSKIVFNLSNDKTVVCVFPSSLLSGISHYSAAFLPPNSLFCISLRVSSTSQGHGSAGYPPTCDTKSLTFTL